MMKITRQLSLSFALTLIFSLTACRTASKNSAVDSPDSASADLSWTEARSRKARLDNVRYDLAVQLNATDTFFTGQSTITFDLKDAGDPLRIDFFEGEVTALKVNGQPADLKAKKKYWIELPAASLKAGANVVSIDYRHEYSTQGQGLHRFLDIETNEIFLYSQFETFDANRFMPCFDQPDLRSSFTLTVRAPSAWQVITTMQESSVKSGPPGTKTWKFPATPRIATYLFSLHAGPYVVWKDRFEDIPLRLFARPSLAKYVQKDEWFKITKQGLAFFNGYFAYKYPFKKYDQLFVPEFNAGAMENVAAVTFSENYLSRSALTRQQKRRQYNTLLHEMAHMWFGDIVTMQWWNNLWLNESFATYMANLAQFEATDYKEIWQTFFAGTKTGAYWEDSLSTTHPIEAPVNSVKDAFATFDGITYGKGASVLKQLRAYVSPASFDKGIQTYMADNAFKNAELKDFIAAIQGQTKADLGVWSERWLKQTGSDKVAATWNCEGGRLQQIRLTTTNKNGAKFRPQTMQVGLFNVQDGKLALDRSVRVTLNQPSETIQGPWPCPQFVYPNYGDDAYTGVALDPKSLDYAKNNLSRIADPLLRTMVWHDVWQMVRDTDLPLKEYVQILERQFGEETDEVILNQITGTLFGRGGENATVLQYWPVATSENRIARTEFIGKIEDQYLRRLNAAKPGTDSQKFWFDNYVEIGRTPKALAQMDKWAHSAKIAPGFPLDIDRHWDLAFQLARYQHPGADQLAADLKKKDPSNRGKNNMLAIEAVRPEQSAKQKNIDLLKMPKLPLSLAEARSVLGALFPPEQNELKKRFNADIYTYLEKNGAADGEERLVNTVAWSLNPLNCEAGESARMKSFIAGHGDFAPTVRKALKVTLEEDERCQRVRAKSAL